MGGIHGWHNCGDQEKMQMHTKEKRDMSRENMVVRQEREEEKKDKMAKYRTDTFGRVYFCSGHLRVVR